MCWKSDLLARYAWVYEMKSFGEKWIEVASVSYLSCCKLNSVDPYVKKWWSILGGP